MAVNMRPVSPAASSLFESLRRLGATLLAILHTRAELFAREFQRERMRITRLLLLGVGALFFFSLGMLTLTMFIIVLFWDSQRLVVIGFLTALYLGIAAGLIIYAKREVARATRPFATTVAELKKDRDQFSSSH
jgi:uncharacterized membrane protein YqjE